MALMLKSIVYYNVQDYTLLQSLTSKCSLVSHKNKFCVKRQFCVNLTCMWVLTDYNYAINTSKT